MSGRYWVLAGVLVFTVAAALFLVRGSASKLSHHEAACELGARSVKDDRSLTAAMRYEAEARRVELCMRANGYGFVNSSLCPEDTWGSRSRRIGVRALQEEDVSCYAPTGWGPRQLYWTDLWIRKESERFFP